jgi:hypothetical protein
MIPQFNISTLLQSQQQSTLDRLSFSQTFESGRNNIELSEFLTNPNGPIYLLVGKVSKDILLARRGAVGEDIIAFGTDEWKGWNFFEPPAYLHSIKNVKISLECSSDVPVDLSNSLFKKLVSSVGYEQPNRPNVKYGSQREYTSYLSSFNIRVSPEYLTFPLEQIFAENMGVALAHTGTFKIEVPLKVNTHSFLLKLYITYNNTNVPLPYPRFMRHKTDENGKRYREYPHHLEQSDITDLYTTGAWDMIKDGIPNVGNEFRLQIFKRLIQKDIPKLNELITTKKLSLDPLYIMKAFRYFASASRDNLGRKPSGYIKVQPKSERDAERLFLYINSNLFLWWTRVAGPEHQLNKKFLLKVPVPNLKNNILENLYKKFQLAIPECMIESKNAGVIQRNINYNKRFDLLLELDYHLMDQLFPGEPSPILHTFVTAKDKSKTIQPLERTPHSIIYPELIK